MDINSYYQANNPTMTYDYWKDYHDRLEAFIKYHKAKIERPTMDDTSINFDYSVEYFNEKVASLCGELDRVKTIMSVLRYKYETDEI